MNDIRAWLDQGRTLTDQATEGPWEASSSEATMNDRSEWKIGKYNRPQVLRSVMRGADAAFIADARTRLPQALDALQAVLDLHAPIDALNMRHRGGRVQQVCIGCGQDDGNWNYWPCPTVRAITDAIGDPQ